MEDKIASVLTGPDADDFYSAALYEMEAGMNFNRGLKWIDSAIELREKSSWWDYRIKAILLMNYGRKVEALSIAQKANEMAKKTKHAYGINEMDRILKELRN